MKDTTIPADLIELKARFDVWRASRKYVREPIPDELWNAAAGLSRRYPPSLVSRVLKIDPSRLKKFLIKRSARASTRKKPQATFFQLPMPVECVVDKGDSVSGRAKSALSRIYDMRLAAQAFSALDSSRLSVKSRQAIEEMETMTARQLSEYNR